MGRRYGMWDPCSTPESEKNKGSEIWLKARPEMKTHCVRADSSQALTSDIRSFVFLTDSSESQGSRIPYLLCILSVKSSWIFLLFPTAEVPFAIPHKRKNQGNFTGEYYTVLMSGSDGWFWYEKADGLSRAACSRESSVFVLSVGIRNCVKEKSAGRDWCGDGGP